MLLGLRDRLRADPVDRERYAAVERGLATRDWADVQQYADAKRGIVAERTTRAS